MRCDSGPSTILCDRISATKTVIRARPSSYLLFNRGRGIADRSPAATIFVAANFYPATTAFLWYLPCRSRDSVLVGKVSSKIGKEERSPMYWMTPISPLTKFSLFSVMKTASDAWKSRNCTMIGRHWRASYVNSNQLCPSTSFSRRCMCNEHFDSDKQSGSWCESLCNVEGGGRRARKARLASELRLLTTCLRATRVGWPFGLSEPNDTNALKACRSNR